MGSKEAIVVSAKFEHSPEEPTTHYPIRYKVGCLWACEDRNLRKTHLPPGRPTPCILGEAESSSLLGLALSPWSGEGNSEQCLFTISTALLSAEPI